eukprot:gene2049-2327_t
MPFAKKVAENGRTFQDEGRLNFSEYSTDERKVVCIVAPYQLADVITDIIQADLPHPLAIKKPFAELRVTMGFTVCIDKFVNLSYAIKVKEIMSMCCRRSVDEEQLLGYYRNELIAKYSKVESKKRPFKAIEKELVNASKRIKVDEATQQNNEIEVTDPPRDPRKRPLDLSRCKLKTLSDKSKLKAKTVKPVARVASKTIANNAPELKADPNSFVVEETNITNRKVEDENAVANLFDDMLLPLIDEPHSPHADVFGDFDLADIVFPNEANEREVKGSGASNILNNAKSVAVDNENERKKKRIQRGKGKGLSFAKLVQRQRERQLLSSDSSSSSDDSLDEE